MIRRIRSPSIRWLCEKGIDNLEDMIDLFWEQPFAFATFVHSRYTEQMTDAFAGRIYEFEHQPSPSMMSFRKLLKRTREYDADDYSIPIGSRYHPERAPLWAARFTGRRYRGMDRTRTGQP